MEKTNCKKCGYVWTPRNSTPVACPNCKRYDWNKESAIVADLSKNGQTPKKMN